MIRRTPIRKVSPQKKQVDYLHRLLKVACMKRDHERCVMCGKPASKHPIHPYDFLDVSHIFAKSVWPLVRFHMLNVKILCRKCHDWWGAHPNEADSWIRQYLGQRKYAELLNAVMYPDPMFRDLSKVETYLRNEIKRYS